ARRQRLPEKEVSPLALQVDRLSFRRKPLQSDGAIAPEDFSLDVRERHLADRNGPLSDLFKPEPVEGKGDVPLSLQHILSDPAPLPFRGQKAGETERGQIDLLALRSKRQVRPPLPLHRGQMARQLPGGQLELGIDLAAPAEEERQRGELRVERIDLPLRKGRLRAASPDPLPRNPGGEMKAPLVDGDLAAALRFQDGNQLELQKRKRESEVEKEEKHHEAEEGISEDHPPLSLLVQPTP